MNISDCRGGAHRRASLFHPCGHWPHRSGREHGYGIGTLRPGQTEPSARGAHVRRSFSFGPHLKELSLKLGSLLQEAAKPIEHIYFPHQGMISLLAVMPEGQGIETAGIGSIVTSFR